MGSYTKHRKTAIAEMRPVTQELLDSNFPFHLVSISEADKQKGSPKVGDMIARNPENHDDKWLVEKEFYQENYEPVLENEDDSGSVNMFFDFAGIREKDMDGLSLSAWIKALHNEASLFENAAMKEYTSGNIHIAHNKMEMGKTCRMIANYLEGNNAGGG